MYDKLLADGFIKPEDTPPELGALDVYFDAFRELGTCRTSGMSLGQIPFTAIVEYSRLYQVEDFDGFLFLMRKLDNTLLDLEHRKSSKPVEAPTNAARKTGKGNRNSDRR